MIAEQVKLVPRKPRPRLYDPLERHPASVSNVDIVTVDGKGARIYATHDQTGERLVAEFETDNWLGELAWRLECGTVSAANFHWRVYTTKRGAVPQRKGVAHA